MSPVIYQKYMHKNLAGTGILDYHCPVENLPYDQFPGWDDPLAYSPLCRPFYKYQKANPLQNTISEAYLYVNEPIVGITACAPFFREGYEAMYGATCIDVNPSGSLNEFIPDNQANSEENFYLVMNPDPALEMNALEKFLGYKDELQDSEFYTSLKRSVEYEFWKLQNNFGAENIVAD